MARPIRIEFEGAAYHVIARGNAKQQIFLVERDYQRFFTILSKMTNRYKIICHAFCLMPNHYHLILETPNGNLSKGMKYLNGVYSQSFNQRHQRVGHLFQGRYTAILIEKDSYLLELSRYIVLNPLRAGLVDDPSNWPWSSYQSTAGLKPVPDHLVVDWILEMFDGKNPVSSRETYQQFVLDGVGLDIHPYVHPFIGKPEFVSRISLECKKKKVSKEISKKERFAGRPDLQTLLSKIRNKTERAEKIYEAYVNHGYTMKEISDVLNIHYVTASRDIERMEMSFCKT